MFVCFVINIVRKIRRFLHNAEVFKFVTKTIENCLSPLPNHLTEQFLFPKLRTIENEIASNFYFSVNG